MPSTIFTIATVAAGLLASTASATGNVAIYWGQGAYQKELSVVCSDPSVDIVNIGFVNGFPKSRKTYPNTNFGNACGGSTFTNPDGTQSNFLSDCPIIERGINTCKANGKKVMLSLGGGYPHDYYLDNVDAYKWLAETLVGSFGPKNSSASWPRPFGDAAVDGFDLDIESTEGTGNYQWQLYGDFVNYLKKQSPSMLISAAPQCIVPDAHLDDAIYRAPFDYIFTQFYNTDACSAKVGYQQLGQAKTAFTYNDWAARLKSRSKNPAVKLYIGLSAGLNGANPNHYLKPEEADALITAYRKKDLFGGVMLWEATVSQNNTIYGQSYSN
ncbi:glycoside hydrolase, partial [Lizonia empirigonia]